MSTSRGQVSGGVAKTNTFAARQETFLLWARTCGCRYQRVIIAAHTFSHAAAQVAAANGPSHALRIAGSSSAAHETRLLQTGAAVLAAVCACRRALLNARANATRFALASELSCGGAQLARN